MVTVPQTTLVPRSTARGALKIRVALRWTWNRRVTRLIRVTVGSFPGSTRLALSCRGRGCPRPPVLIARGRRGLRGLLRKLRGRRYRAGDELIVTLTATGYRPERAAIVIRWGREPRVRLLGG